jgi:hypothetical protein
MLFNQTSQQCLALLVFESKVVLLTVSPMVLMTQLSPEQIPFDQNSQQCLALLTFESKAALLSVSALDNF